MIDKFPPLMFTIPSTSENFPIQKKMFGGDNSESKKATQKNPKQEDAQLISLGEIDEKYLKILRMKGDEQLADYYDLRRRFNSAYNVPEYVEQSLPTEPSKLPGQDVSSMLEISDAVEKIEYDPSEKSKGMKMGGISRKILQPEHPTKNQPLKMKKGKPSEFESFGFEQSKSLEKGDIWVTSDIDGNVNREAYVKHAIKDFLLYMIFLIIVNMITFGVLDHAYNYYANVLSEIITNTQFDTSLGLKKTFNEIRSVQQIWDFIEKVLLKVLYEYGSDHTRTITKSHEVLVLFENILIGAPRVRQLRVRNDSCKTQQMFSDLFSTCYDYFSEEKQDKLPFGKKFPTAWTYTEPDQNSAHYNGKISIYGGGGYMMNITKDVRYTKEWIRQLIQTSWIRQGTRAVFIDFTTYTPNTNLFCVVKLVFELPPTGGVIPTAHFYTMKFLRYVNTWDHIVLGCEIVLLCYIVYFTMEEIQQVVNLKEEYLYSWWNLLDIAILIVAYTVIVTGCIRYVIVSNGMAEKVNHINTRSHASFDNFVHVQRTFNTAAALLSFLVWLKLLKFAALNKSVALILSVFGRVKFELIALTMMMFTMVVGFALLGNMLFGTSVEQFNTIWNSVFTLVGIFVGGLYFYLDCANARPFLAPVYFLLFILIVLILFLNAYVALIVHGFQKAVEEFEDQRDRVYLIDILRTMLYKILKLIRKNNWADKLRNRRVAKQYKKDYDDLLKIVQKHGYRGLDLTMLFRKHNISPKAPMNFDQMSQVYNEIDAKNQLFLEVDEHDRILDQVDAITKKVDGLDKSMTDAVAKVDNLVDRLLSSEGARK